MVFPSGQSRDRYEVINLRRDQNLSRERLPKAAKREFNFQRKGRKGAFQTYCRSTPKSEAEAHLILKTYQAFRP